MTHVRFAELDGILQGDRAPGAPVVVLLHGFGAPGDDLVGLAGPLASAVPGTRFVFLAAPIDLGPMFLDGRAWWRIDLEARLRRQAAGIHEDVTEDPAGLAEARAQLVASLRAIVDELKPSRLVLGGFSQGAMLSLDTALRSDVALDGLLLLSGTHMAANAWKEGFAARKGLRVFASHGQEDPILPYPVSENLARVLEGAGLDVTFVAFDDGHGIPPALLPEVRSFLARVLTA